MTLKGIAKMKILFLDVDGVLNNWLLIKEQGMYALGEKQLDELKRIIDSTGAEIVLSSTWREYPESVKVLEANLALRNLSIKDYTPSLNIEMGAWVLPSSIVPRHREISFWLENNPEVEDFAILDDNSDAGIEGHFFLTDMQGEGLTEEVGSKVIEHFEKS